MKEELKQAAEAVISHPKTAAVIAATNAFDWISDNIDPVLSVTTKLASLILVVILIRYHHVNTQKIKQDIEKEK